MSRGLSSAIETAQRKLGDQADPKSAPERKRYLKSPYEVLSCGVPWVRAQAKAVRMANAAPGVGDLANSLQRLWQSSVHEEKLLAIFIAGEYEAMFDEAHVAGLFHAWLAGSANWDFVDTICTENVGKIARRRPAAWKIISRWSRDPWMWLRRASLISHIPAIRTGGPEIDLLRRTCHRLVDEKEFFIRKAIGWTLRELSKRDAEAAERIIAEIGAKASGLTLREALKRMPAGRRADILAALGRD